MESRAPETRQPPRIGPHELPPRDAVLVGAALGLGGFAVVVAIQLVFSTSGFALLIGAVTIAAWWAGGLGGTAAIAVAWGLTAIATAPSTTLDDLSVGGSGIRWASSFAISVVVAIVITVMRRAQTRAASVAASEERSRLGVERLQSLTAALSAALTVEEVAGVLVESVPALLGARGAALGLIEGDDLVVVEPRGARAPALPGGTRLPIGTRAPIAAAARDGKPAWAQRRHQLLAEFPATLELAPYASAALGVPIFVNERLAGSLGFAFGVEDAITPEVLAVARIAADLGGQALERAGLYELERSSREALDRILAVAPRFQQDATPEAAVASICAEARRAFACDVAQIWMPVDDEALEVTWRDPPHEATPPGTRIAWSDVPGLLDEMRAFRSMYVADVQRDGRGGAHAHALEAPVVSSLRIPIVIGARFERILVLQWERVVAEPVPSVIAVMRRFADQAGLAIEQAERRRAQKETRALQAVTEALAAAATPTDVGVAIVREGVSAIGADGVAVYALAEDGGGLEMVACDGYAPEERARWEHIPLDRAAAVVEAVTTRELVVCATQAEVVARFPDRGRADGALVAMPLVAGGRVVGGIVFSSYEEHRFETRLGLAVGLARQAAQALDRARLFEQERAAAERLLKLHSVTAALSQAVTLEDVSRTCLEHAVAGIGASEGVVVLRPPAASPSSSAPVVVAAVGDGGGGGRVPEGAAQPVREALGRGRVATSEAGWLALPLGSSGALAVRRASIRRLPEADREWLVTLVGQGAQALDRAARYETERSIAETLQRSVLPEQLPSADGVAVAARYLPGTVGVDVGGDWYDVIQLDDGRLGLCVGDVVGKGVQAAAMMGQLRNALRAFAFEHDDPAEVVARLGRLVDATTEDAFATLAYLVLDPRERRIRYVLAGHPPPLIREPDGAASFLDGGRSLPIGVDASFEATAGEATLCEGTTIVLYTDGLVERHDASLDVGLDRLAAAVGVCRDDPDALVDAVVESLLGEEARPDDVAILAVRLTTRAVEGLRLVLPSTQEGLVEMRDGLRAWLADAGIGAGDATDTVLAVWEACANAVEHAQQPSEASFRLSAQLDDASRIRIEVEDTGRWKRGDANGDRGHGLGLMRALMDAVEIETGDAGTRVLLERALRTPGGV